MNFVAYHKNGVDEIHTSNLLEAIECARLIGGYVYSKRDNCVLREIKL